MYKRMRDLREDNDKTQKELAEMLGVGTTQYRRWEVGEHKVPAEVIEKLAKIYNVSSDYILGLTNVQEPRWTAKNNVNISHNKNTKIGKITIK